MRWTLAWMLVLGLTAGCTTYVVRVKVTPGIEHAVAEADVQRAIRIVEDVSRLARAQLCSRHDAIYSGRPTTRLVVVCTISHGGITTSDKTRVALFVAEDETFITFWIRDFSRGEESELVRQLRKRLLERVASELPGYDVEVVTERMFPPA